MKLYEKSAKAGEEIRNTICELSFHPTIWGCGIAGGKESVGFGLKEHYEWCLRIIFLCWSFEIVRETFVDEDGLVGNDRSVI
jgi:hypothetical protein